MKKLILTLAVAVSALGLNAQILWKVSGNGAKGDSYLFGTHHVAPYTIMDEVKGFNDALKSVDAVIGEIDMINLDAQAMTQSTMQHAIAPADSTLSKVFTTAQLDSINTILGKYSQGQLRTEMLEAMKPALISTTLAMLQTQTVFPDFDQSQQLDAKVQQRGHQGGKAIGAFETVEEQLSFLLDTPISEQAKQLMSGVRDDDKAADMAKNLANAYMSQNLPDIKAIMDETEDEPDAMKALIDDRNKRWVAKLGEILPQQTVLVAVGVGHLPGKNGLIKLLQDKGYTVTPVK